MKILYITTVSGTVNAFLLPHIELLMELGYKVDIACNITRPINKVILDRGCRIFEMEFNRSPLNKRNLTAFKNLKELILKEKYDIVHTHTPVASTLARMVCKNLSNVKVFYTAHGFHFYKGAPFKNWLIYYPIERWLSKYTDVLITINNEDYSRAKKSFKSDKIEYISGIGLDTRKFSDVAIDKIEKRRELDIPDKSLVLLSVGELNKNKNHETIIRAIARLDNPCLYYVICGQGILKNYLQDLSKELGVENKVKVLGTRNDIAEICKASDVFVFPSFREGLSVALMEAMASGLPIVCSNIRGNTDLVEHEKGGYLVKPQDIEGFVDAIEKLVNNYDIRINMGKSNMDKVKMFSINNVRNEMLRIYKESIQNIN